MAEANRIVRLSTMHGIFAFPCSGACTRAHDFAAGCVEPDLKCVVAVVTPKVACSLLQSHPAAVVHVVNTTALETQYATCCSPNLSHMSKLHCRRGGDDVDQYNPLRPAPIFSTVKAPPLAHPFALLP
jgi:hypothetical protein